MRRAMKTTLAAGLLLALFAGVALAAEIDCTGGLCQGTNRNDTLFGTPGFDEINGRGNSDTVLGRGGNDTLRGDFNTNPDAVEGDDRVEGGAGDDFLLGEGGDDLLIGNTGNDFIDAKDPASRSEDAARGGRGRDEIESTDDRPDAVDCGPGTSDTVRFDKNLDTVENCERRVPQ